MRFCLFEIERARSFAATQETHSQITWNFLGKQINLWNLISLDKSRFGSFSEKIFQYLLIVSAKLNIQ